MTKKLVIPHFRTEDEEVRWYDSHKREVEDEMARRIDSEDFLVCRAGSQDVLTPVTIRMNPEDLKAIRKRAAEKGFPYQAYIRLLLRDVLRHAKRRAS